MATTAGRFPTTALLLSTPEEVAPQAEAQAWRLAAIAGGGLLALFGVWRGGLLGLASAGAGAWIVARSNRTWLHAYEDRWHSAHAAVTVLAPPDEIYRRWRGPGRLASLVSILRGAQPLADGEVRLLVTSRRGRPLAWDVRITEDVPGERLAWRAVRRSEVPGDGEILFRPAPGGRGTELHLRLLIGPPAGFAGAVAAGLLGHSGEPGRALADDLRRFKQRLEAGDIATTEGQPRGAGRRSLQRLSSRVLPAALSADPRRDEEEER